MKQGDVLLQRWRIRMAARHLPREPTCSTSAAATAFSSAMLEGRIASGVGVDSDSVPEDFGAFRFIRGTRAR